MSEAHICAARVAAIGRMDGWLTRAQHKSFEIFTYQLVGDVVAVQLHTGDGLHHVTVRVACDCMHGCMHVYMCLHVCSWEFVFASDEEIMHLHTFVY